MRRCLIYSCNQCDVHVNVRPCLQCVQIFLNLPLHFFRIQIFSCPYVIRFVADLLFSTLGSRIKNTKIRWMRVGGFKNIQMCGLHLGGLLNQFFNDNNKYIRLLEIFTDSASEFGITVLITVSSHSDILVEASWGFKMMR